MTDELTPFCYLSDVKSRYAKICAHFVHYTQTHKDVDSVRAMLRYSSIEMEKLHDSITFLYGQSIITEDTYVKCTYLYTDLNDELLTAYYSFIKK